jgi:hypothetical protein
MRRIFKYVTPAAFGVWIVGIGLLTASVIYSGDASKANSFRHAALGASFLGAGINLVALTVRRRRDRARRDGTPRM